MSAKALRIALGCACAMLLAACAHPTGMRAVDTLASVTEKLGAPDARLTTESGSISVYSHQGAGTDVYWVYFDKKGAFVKTVPVLDEEHFALVVPGKTTMGQVYQLFGKPAWHYTLHLLDQEAVIYRYREFSGQRMAFWVQYDKTGLVTDASTIIDPMDNDFMRLVDF